MGHGSMIYANGMLYANASMVPSDDSNTPASNPPVAQQPRYVKFNKVSWQAEDHAKSRISSYVKGVFASITGSGVIAVAAIAGAGVLTVATGGIALIAIVGVIILGAGAGYLYYTHRKDEITAEDRAKLTPEGAQRIEEFNAVSRSTQREIEAKRDASRKTRSENREEIQKLSEQVQKQKIGTKTRGDTLQQALERTTTQLGLVENELSYWENLARDERTNTRDTHNEIYGLRESVRTIGEQISLINNAIKQNDTAIATTESKAHRDAVREVG